MILEYYSNVEEGQLQIGVRKRVQKELRHFEGKRVRIRIDKFNGKRSHLQNNLWHSYIDLVAKEIGYEHDELHEIAKYKFLKAEKIDERTGEILPYIRSTTDLSKEEFSDLIDKYIRWVAQTFSMALPVPGEDEWQIKTTDDPINL